MEIDGNIPQVDQVIFIQTTCEFCVITPIIKYRNQDLKKKKKWYL